MSKNANPVAKPPSEPDIGLPLGTGTVSQPEEAPGNNLASKKQITRLPWTSSSTEGSEGSPVPAGAGPWLESGREQGSLQGGATAIASDNGKEQKAHTEVGGGSFSGTKASKGGSPFAVPSGPMPQDIPGFPFPDDMPGDWPELPGSFQGGESDNQQGEQGSLQGAEGSTQGKGAIKPLKRLPAVMASGPATVPEGNPNHRPPTTTLYQPQAAGVAPAPYSPIHFPQVQPATTNNRLNSALLNAQSGSLSSDQLATGYLDPLEVMFHEPRNIQETGLNQGMIFDLVLKSMYYTSYMSGQEISAALRLPFYGIIDQIINLLKKEQLCEVSGAAGLGEAGYQYILTIKGMERAHQVMQRSKYVGPAPVPLSRYIDVVKLQSTKKPLLNRQTVENALQGFIISEDLINQVGSSVNAGKSLFLFGAPGNGKTLLTERIARMLGGNVIIPYALEADGQIIQLFDLNSHHAVVPPGANESDTTKAELGDRRWLKIQKPVVVVGGELTMASLDLIYNENVGFYEAPFQLKANGGLFLIDDFGRQQASPQALLNRWIVPLEKGIDFLTLKTGKKLQIPFDLFLVLSTNLQPEDLIDEAFLRRIQNKLFVPDPTPQQYYEIFLGQCRMMNIPFDQRGFTHLVNKHYVEAKRPFRASQPRDLLRQLLGIARYRNVPPELTPELLDSACSTYFVNIKPK